MGIPMNDISFIRETLYDLKKRHKAEIKIIEIVSQEQSNFTGQRIVNRKTINIKKAIRLPYDLKRSFAQDIAYLAANKNFTYGALNDYKTETFVIDFRDVPNNFVPNLSHYIAYKNRRFDIADIGGGEEQGYFVYIAKEVAQDTSQTTPGVYPPTSDNAPVVTETLEEILSFEFFFGDAPRPIYTPTKSGVIVEVSVRYRTAFNSANPTLTVGLNSNPTQLLDVNHSDPTIACEFSVDLDQPILAGESVTLNINPDGASQGSGIVTLLMSYND